MDRMIEDLIDEYIRHYLTVEVEEGLVEELTEQQQKMFLNHVRRGLEDAVSTFKEKRGVDSVSEDIVGFLYDATYTLPSIYEALKKAGIDDEAFAFEILRDFRGMLVGERNRSGMI